MGLVHLGLVKCPICSQIFKIPEFAAHLKEDHKIPISLKTVKMVTPKIFGDVYEYGEPFWEIGRQLIPTEKWQTERVYNAEYNGHLEDTSTGQPVTIAKPTEFIYETIRQLRENGLRAQYIRVSGANATIQAAGSPAAWYVYVIVLIAIAVAAYLFGSAFQMVAESLYRIFIAPIPPEWRPYFLGAIVLIGGLFAVGYAYSKIRGK